MYNNRKFVSRYDQGPVKWRKEPLVSLDTISTIIAIVLMLIVAHLQ